MGSNAQDKVFLYAEAKRGPWKEEIKGLGAKHFDRDVLLGHLAVICNPAHKDNPTVRENSMNILLKVATGLGGQERTEEIKTELEVFEDNLNSQVFTTAQEKRMRNNLINRILTLHIPQNIADPIANPDSDSDSDSEYSVIESTTTL